MSALGIDYHPAHYDIVLPVGISFDTFATMSLDVYLRRAEPARNLLDYPRGHRRRSGGGVEWRLPYLYNVDLGCA